MVLVIASRTRSRYGGRDAGLPPGRRPHRSGRLAGSARIDLSATLASIDHPLRAMPEDLALRYGDRPLSASLPLPSSKGGYSSSVREPLVERPARLSQTMTSVAESPLRRSNAEDPRARRSESDRMFVSEGPDGRRIVTREGPTASATRSPTESDRVRRPQRGATDLARRPATAQPSFAPRRSRGRAS